MGVVARKLNHLTFTWPAHAFHKVAASATVSKKCVPLGRVTGLLRAISFRLAAASSFTACDGVPRREFRLVTTNDLGGAKPQFQQVSREAFFGFRKRLLGPLNKSEVKRAS